MTKAEIISKISEKTGVEKVTSLAVVEAFMSEVKESISNNQAVFLRGFGTFAVKHRMPKKARNPATGDPVYLPERYVPVFKPSKLMKNTVNDKLIEY